MATQRMSKAERDVWTAVIAAVLGSLANKRRPRPHLAAHLASEYADAAVNELQGRRGNGVRK